MRECAVAPSSAGLLLGLLLAAATSACGGRTRVANADASSGGASRARETSVTCGGCHEAAVREWDESLHHASFSSPDFQASYREEPLEFCVSCHAPRRAALGVEVGNAHGIDCASCHPGVDVHEREALGSRRAGSASAPKLVVACATCHELTSVGSATLLQSTASEHE